MDCSKVVNWDFLFAKHESKWIYSCCTKHDCFLSDFCLNDLICTANLSLCDFPTVQNCANAIVRITTILKSENKSVAENIEDQLLQYVFQFIDYIFDVVRYASVNIFGNLLILHKIRCCDCITNKSNCKWIKKITQFLVDLNALSAFRLRALSRLFHFVGAKKQLISNECFEQFYLKIGDSSIVNVISQLITDDLSVVPERHSFHVECIKKCLISESTLIRTAIKERILLSLLKFSHLKTWFVENFYFLSDLPECSLYFLEGKLSLTKFAILHQKTVSISQGWDDFLPLKTLLIGLLCDNDDLKLTAWDLLCEHPKNARQFSIFELELAKRFISCNFTEQSPSKRQKIFKGISKILERLRDSSVHLFRDAVEEISDSQKLLRAYSDFLQYLYRLAFFSLSMQSNFNRRISSLMLINFLFGDDLLVSKDVDLKRSFKINEWLTENNIVVLLKCLDDDYQICQETSFAILTTKIFQELDFDFRCLLNQKTKLGLFFVDDKVLQAFSTVSNYRLRFFCLKFSDISFQLLEELLVKCEAVIRQIEKSFVQILNSKTLPYPLLASVEHILWAINFMAIEEKRDKLELLVFNKLIPICFKFADIVSPVCHSLSPEGFIPSNIFESDWNTKQDINSLTKLRIDFAQKLLVSCWRTHKSISSIFSFIVSQFKFSKRLVVDVLHTFGNYLWLQLTECRHCGAFESSAQAFEALCVRLWRINQNIEKFKLSLEMPLPCLKKWLEKALDAITQKGGAEKFCLTRRSAGLPHLISVIVATSKNEKHFSFLSFTVNRLIHCCKHEEINEIHCVNVLKALFSNSLLGESIQAFVEPAMCFCLNGCASLNWEVRNAHCQFFAALIHRVFGTPKNAQRTLHVQNHSKMSSFNFFSRYSSLYSIFQKRLLANNKCIEFGKFPVLILLSRLHSSTELETKFPLSTFFAGVLRLLFSSSIQKMRELSAAAFLSISSIFEIEETLRCLGENINNSKKLLPENVVNAILILVASMFDLGLLNEKYNLSLLELSRNLLAKIFEQVGFLSRCDFNRSALLALIQKIGSNDFKLYVGFKFCAFLTIILRPLKNAHSDIKIPSAENLINNWHCAFRPIGMIFAQFQSVIWPKLYHNFHECLRFEGSDNGALVSQVKRQIRYEAYRFICLEAVELENAEITTQGLNITSDNLVPQTIKTYELILRDVLQDLKHCSLERYLEFVILVLVRETDHFCELLKKYEIENDELLLIFNKAMIYCRSIKNQLNMYRLKYRLLMANLIFDSDDNTFLINTKNFLIKILQKSQDENERFAALEFAEEIIEKSNGVVFLKKASIALKDECGVIRNYAAKFVARHLLPNFSETVFNNVGLNAEVCWSLALERFPDLAEEINVDEMALTESCEKKFDSPQLFKACPQNIFAENFAIYDFISFKKVFSHFEKIE